MADLEFPWQDGSSADFPVVIAGGGISGLYCAYRLAQRGHRVVVLERSKRWGGRIETLDMAGFTAEYGPMRFELELQPRFRKLVETLGIETAPFPGPTPEPTHFPVYDLAPEERPLTSLQLLRRGVLLLLGRKLDPSDPVGLSHQSWIDTRDEDDYQQIREHASVGSQPLWRMGFWNALASEGVLSHPALMKVRDTGTFYHMIPENLNAVEWAIWWLRAFRTAGEDMVWLRGGSAELTHRLMARLEGEFADRVKLFSNVELTQFDVVPGSADLVQVFVKSRSDGTHLSLTARHLVLALPQWPLQQLKGWLPSEIQTDIESVEGFPMTKIFYVTREPWWERGEKPQSRANQMPTREVHYFRREEPDSKEGEREVDDGWGMVLLYTDRPATEYWNVYVLDKEGHDEAEIYVPGRNENAPLKEQFVRWLAKDADRTIRAVNELVAAAAETETEELHTAIKSSLEALSRMHYKEGDVDLADACERLGDLSVQVIERYIESTVVTYGIRDWSRPPYGAANHSWKPGVKSWEVRERLRAFSLPKGVLANLHVCGEAYSDYSGFIEGALRSADDVLSTIADAPASQPVGTSLEQGVAQSA